MDWHRLAISGVLTLSCNLSAAAADALAEASANLPPWISAGGSCTVLEDAGACQNTVTIGDDGPTPYVLDFVSGSGDDRVAFVGCNKISDNKFIVRFTPAPDRFTAATRANLTIRIADREGAISDLPIQVTITPTNDPPTVSVKTGASDAVSCPTDTDAGAAVGADIAVTEGRDSIDLGGTTAATAQHAGAGYLRCRLSVVDGIDGADLLGLRDPDGLWSLTYDSTSGQERIRHRTSTSSTTWTTIAQWNRKTGFATPGRTDQVAIILLATTTPEILAQLPGLVTYRWLPGTPPIGSDFPHTRTVSIVVDEPEASRYATSEPLQRTIALQAANRAPTVTADPLVCNPNGDAPLALHISDDDPHAATISVAAGHQPRAGHFYRAGGDAGTAITTFAYADAGLIRYRHTEADSDADSAVLTVDDHDARGSGSLSGSCTVEIRIVPDKPRLAVLGDPLLQATIGVTATWPLAFTHPLSATPTLAAYPGLGGIPAGVTIAADGSGGFRLVFDWTQIDSSRGFLAFVVHAGTAALPAGANAVDQSMLIRLIAPAAAEPHAVRLPGTAD